MLVIIKDAYYRNTPEQVGLSAYISLRDPCHLTCNIDFKAGHAPEQAGDRSRPPQNLVLMGEGGPLKPFLESDPNSPVRDHMDFLEQYLEEVVRVSSSSKRWPSLKLEVVQTLRDVFEVSVQLEDSREVATIFVPVGVFVDMRKGWHYVRRKMRDAGLVLSWSTPTYGYSLPYTANWLD